MPAQKNSVNQHPTQTLLTWITEKEIAIPEIQRPFVWEATKVRDLMDSLLNGFPVGYLIAWRNPNVRLKEATASSGKRILIEGPESDPLQSDREFRADAKRDQHRHRQ